MKRTIRKLQSRNLFDCIAGYKLKKMAPATSGDFRKATDPPSNFFVIFLELNDAVPNRTCKMPFQAEPSLLQPQHRTHVLAPQTHASPPYRAHEHRQQISDFLQLACSKVLNHALQSRAGYSRPYGTEFTSCQVALMAIAPKQLQSLNEILSTPE